MRVACIIQTMEGSEALPQKILQPLAGKPVLWHVITRLKQAKRVDEVMVATTYLKFDDGTAALARKCDVRVFRGERDNVLLRYYDAAQMAEADVIVRVFANNPLIDPVTVDQVVENLVAGHYDYFATPVPVRYPHGEEAEAFSFDALTRVIRRVRWKSEKANVTEYMYHHQEAYRCGWMAGESFLIRPSYRLCVDTPADYELLKRLYARLYEPDTIISAESAVAFLDARPDLVKINQEKTL